MPLERLLAPCLSRSGLVVGHGDGSLHGRPDVRPSANRTMHETPLSVTSSVSASVGTLGRPMGRVAAARTMGSRKAVHRY